MLKQTLILTLLFTWSEASVVTLTDILDNAKEPRLLSQSITEEQQALEAKNLANNADAPFVLYHEMTRANSQALSGYEYEIGFSKEIKLGNIQALERQQHQLDNEAHTIEQERYLITASNHLKNLYHQYCLNKAYRETFQKTHDNLVTIYKKKKRAYQHDEIAKTELLQLELEKNRLHNELEIFHQQLEDEKYQLLDLAGFMEGDAISCQEVYSIAEQAVFDNAQTSLTQKAFEKRIESRKVGLKRHSYKVESVEVSMGYTKELQTDRYTVGVSIPLNFSSHKSEHERASLMHEVSALSFQNEQLLAQKNYAMTKLQNKLYRTFKSIQSTEGSIKEYKNSLLPLMKKSYDYGESSVIEYLLSQQTLSQLQQELLEKQKGYYTTLFQLYSMSETKDK